MNLVDNPAESKASGQRGETSLSLIPGKPGCYRILVGESLWRAAQVVGVHCLPVYVQTLLAEEGAFENIRNPILCARAMMRLLQADPQLTRSALAARTGMTLSSVNLVSAFPYQRLSISSRTLKIFFVEGHYASQKAAKKECGREYYPARVEGVRPAQVEGASPNNDEGQETFEGVIEIG